MLEVNGSHLRYDYKNKRTVYHGIPFTGIGHYHQFDVWYKEGQYHREDGPAEIHYNGFKTYWLNNKNYTENRWKQEIKNRGLTSPEYFKNLL